MGTGTAAQLCLWVGITDETLRRQAQVDVHLAGACKPDAVLLDLDLDLLGNTKCFLRRTVFHVS
jgi:hypothetical protein